MKGEDEEEESTSTVFIIIKEAGAHSLVYYGPHVVPCVAPVTEANTCIASGRTSDKTRHDITFLATCFDSVHPWALDALHLDSVLSRDPRGLEKVREQSEDEASSLIVIVVGEDARTKGSREG